MMRFKLRDANRLIDDVNKNPSNNDLVKKLQFLLMPVKGILLCLVGKNKQKYWQQILLKKLIVWTFRE